MSWLTHSAFLNTGYGLGTKNQQPISLESRGSNLVRNPPTYCAACTALQAAAKALSITERKARWRSRIECTSIASSYAIAMVLMLMTCFPGRAPALSSYKRKLTHASAVQVKLGACIAQSLSAMGLASQDLAVRRCWYFGKNRLR